MDYAVLETELATGHPVTGAYSVEDAIAAGQLNAANRINTTIGISDGIWHHFAFVLRAAPSSAAGLVFLDGVDKTGDDNAGTPDGATAAVVIGSRSGTFGFPGRLWGLGQYCRALLPSEIQQLYSDPWAMYRLRARVFPAAAAEAPGDGNP